MHFVVSIMITSIACGYAFIITGTVSNKENFFAKRVSVLFDDKKRYNGAIIGQQDGSWVTCFEDGTEDTSKNPLRDDDDYIITDCGSNLYVGIDMVKRYSL